MGAGLRFVVLLRLVPVDFLAAGLRFVAVLLGLARVLFFGVARFVAGFLRVVLLRDELVVRFVVVVRFFGVLRVDFAICLKNLYINDCRVSTLLIK